jgi:hypothetical protein
MKIPVDSICIEDFCGSDGVGDLEYWADWSPSTKLVYFGGNWVGVPLMKSETQPTPEQVTEWADKHGIGDELLDRTLAEVEEMYRNGRVSQDDYEHYCYLWRNSAFRYTDLCIAHQEAKCSIN